MRNAAYYNEHDPKAAAWIRELIKAKAITDGEVDERSIEDVIPADLAGFQRCHFFAGIGVWDYALNRAGWPDDRRVWTGSCPCQPFSAAGKGGGFDDERHLWPAWFHLINVGRPDTVFGEQVASKDGLTWLDLVSSDVEGIGYTIAPIDIPAAGFGAPHIRQRLFFVADAGSSTRERRAGGFSKTKTGIGSTRQLDGNLHQRSSNGGENGDRMADGEQSGRQRRLSRWTDSERQDEPGHVGRSGSTLTNGFWRDAEWIYCTDQKYRPTGPIEPVFQFVFDGTAAVLGDRWNTIISQIKEEVTNYANTTESSAGEVLFAMWNAVAAETIRENSGGFSEFYEPTVLLVALCQLARDSESQFILSASYLREIEGRTMRILWSDEQPSCSPQERRLDGSQPGQFANAVCEVPSVAPQHEESEMPTLRDEIPQTTDVSEALSAVAKVWRSVFDEDKGRADLRTCKSVLVAIRGFPLASRVPGRVGLLRGAGNAIVSEAAQAFIESYLEAVGKR